MENILRVSITVIETRVEVWENEKFKWHGNTRGPQGECFYAISSFNIDKLLQILIST